MCLDRKITKTSKRIKNPIIGKKYIICYSKALRKYHNYYPVWNWKNIPYKLGWNESDVTYGVFFDKNFNRKYMPYFHRFRDLKDARNYKFGSVILKWKVFVKDITCVGLQNNAVVVVAKKCLLMGEVK